MIHGDIINKQSYPTPLEDVRLHPSPKLSWDDLLVMKKQMLQAYQITIGLLSRLEPTNLSQLRYVLIYKYFSPGSVDDLFYFITTNETKHIEFDEEDNCLKSEKLFRKPRIKISIPTGPHSIWLPSR